MVNKIQISFCPQWIEKLSNNVGKKDPAQMIGTF